MLVDDSVFTDQEVIRSHTMHLSDKLFTMPLGDPGLRDYLSIPLRGAKKVIWLERLFEKMVVHKAAKALNSEKALG